MIFFYISMVKFIVEVITSLIIFALVIIGFAVDNSNNVFMLIGIVAIIQLLHAMFWKYSKRSGKKQ